MALERPPGKLLAIAFLFAGLSVPAQAEDLLGEYLAWLGAEDSVNSRGEPLTSFGAIIAQDRANFHRFGIRQDLDTSDPFFADRAMRAKLPQLYEAGRRVETYIQDDVLNGDGHYVYVRIMGEGGAITHIDVFEGAG